MIKVDYKIQNKQELVIVLTYIKNTIIKSNVDRNEISHTLKYKKIISMLDRIYKGTYGKTHLWNTSEVSNIKWSELADSRCTNVQFFNCYIAEKIESDIVDIIDDGLEIYTNISMDDIEKSSNILEYCLK